MREWSVLLALSYRLTIWIVVSLLVYYLTTQKDLHAREDNCETVLVRAGLPMKVTTVTGMASLKYRAEGAPAVFKGQQRR